MREREYLFLFFVSTLFIDSKWKFDDKQISNVCIEADGMKCERNGEGGSE